MIKIIIKSIIVIIISICTYVLITYVSIYTKYHDRLEYKEFINNKYQLLKTSDTPKIIIIGGSNLAYGINSETIHNKYQMPVINCGLNAGVGLKFMIESVKPYIKSGDIVVLSPEYEHFYGNFFYGDNPLLEICFLFPEGLTRVNWINYDQLKAITFCNMWREISLNVFQKNPNPLNKSFNKYGDIISHLKAKPVSPLYYNKITSNDMNLAALDSLVDLSKFIQSKNANILFSFPPITKQKFSDEHKLITDLSAKIINIMPNTFSLPSTYAYDEFCFFDSVYHLNGKYRDVRTIQLINEISNIRQD